MKTFTFYERYELLCNKLNINVYNVPNNSPSTVDNWKNNGSIPTGKKLVELSAYFDCSIDYLLGISDIESIITLEQLKQNIPPADKQILDQYHSLSKTNKSIVDYILEMEEESVAPVKIYHFPVFFQSAAAGIGQLSEINDYQMEKLEIQDIPKEAKFGMYIEGNSMETDIYERDIVLLDPSQISPDKLNGRIVVALFGEELICKKLSVNHDAQTYDFLSDNPESKDKNRLNQKQDDFKIIGRVVKVIHADVTGYGLVSYHD